MQLREAEPLREMVSCTEHHFRPAAPLALTIINTPVIAFICNVIVIVLSAGTRAVFLAAAGVATRYFRWHGTATNSYHPLCSIAT